MRVTRHAQARARSEPSDYILVRSATNRGRTGTATELIYLYKTYIRNRPVNRFCSECVADCHASIKALYKANVDYWIDREADEAVAYYKANPEVILNPYIIPQPENPLSFEYRVDIEDALKGRKITPRSSQH